MPRTLQPPPVPPPGKPLRADARRNYDRLLAAAREAVAEHGVEASLDDIAKRAGVGSGTLYRHFPTRPALLEAVFREQIALLFERAKALADDPREPMPRLRDWMHAFLEYLVRYRGLAMTLKSVIDSDAEVFATCHDQLRWSAGVLLTAAQEAGVARRDVEPSDLLRIASGIGLVSELTPDGAERSERLFEIVMSGLRP